jgi:hypothetical protein
MLRSVVKVPFHLSYRGNKNTYTIPLDFRQWVISLDGQRIRWCGSALG